MKKEEYYCPLCGKKEYATESKMLPVLRDEYGHPLNGTPMYEFKLAYCPQCNTIVWIDEVTRENDERAWEAEREYFGIISHKDLLRLPKKYAVSRDRIEEILDFDLHLRKKDTWGVSVWEGKPLKKEASERVEKALESPTYFLERMEAIKDTFPEEWYERTHKRIAKMAAKEKRLKERKTK